MTHKQQKETIQYKPDNVQEIHLYAKLSLFGNKYNYISPSLIALLGIFILRR